MSWAAFEKNCPNCEYHRLLKAGKMDFDARPCPEDTRTHYRGKGITPQQVNDRMRSEWICPARVPVRLRQRAAAKGGAR